MNDELVRRIKSLLDKLSEPAKTLKHRNWKAGSKERLRELKSGKRMSDDAKDKIGTKNGKQFAFTKDGQVFRGSNLARFCRENGLSYHPMSKVKNGKLDSYLGYRRSDEGPK